MLATVTRLLLALKLKIKREIADKRKRESGSSGGEGAAAVLQSGWCITKLQGICSYIMLVQFCHPVGRKDQVAARDEHGFTFDLLIESATCY